MTSLYHWALDELGGAFDRLSDADVDTANEMIANANKIVVFAGGREKLQIMGFAMRPYHVGLSVAVEREMYTITPEALRLNHRNMG